MSLQMRLLFYINKYLSVFGDYATLLSGGAFIFWIIGFSFGIAWLVNICIGYLIFILFLNDLNISVAEELEDEDGN